MKYVGGRTRIQRLEIGVDVRLFGIFSDDDGKRLQRIHFVDNSGENAAFLFGGVGVEGFRRHLLKLLLRGFSVKRKRDGHGGGDEYSEKQKREGINEKAGAAGGLFIREKIVLLLTLLARQFFLFGKV